MRTLFAVLLTFFFCTVATDTNAQDDSKNNSIAVRAIFPNYSWPLKSVDKLMSDHFTHGVEFEYYHHLNKNLALSFPISLKRADVPVNDEGSIIENMNALGLDILLNANFVDRSSRLVPFAFVGAGAGLYDIEEVTFNVPLGLGLNIKVVKKIMLSFTGSYRFSPEDYKSHIQAGAGFNFYFGGDNKIEPPPVMDRDEDGIVDAEDLCPDTPGTAAHNGCPDTDDDGIADGSDACPKLAGTAALNGCPDTDGDGLADNSDECPNEVGPRENNGCPITDRDGDGVADADDNCPNQPGTSANKGCPDRDNDGVVDGMDACPDVPGDAANKGCPEITQEDKETLDFAVQAVAFESASAKLLPASELVLNDIADIMRRYPSHKLAIKGHTDSIGEVDDNQSLSERRAKACYDYLVSQGIDGARMGHAGYGESQPIETNMYEPGREKNRRVEFTLYIE